MPLAIPTKDGRSFVPTKDKVLYVLAILSVLALIFFFINKKISAKQELKAWLSSASSEDLQFVQEVRKLLSETEEGDFILKKNGKILYVKGRKGIDEITTISSVKALDHDMVTSFFDDLHIYRSFERIIDQDDPEYDKFAGQFFRQK